MTSEIIKKNKKYLFLLNSGMLQQVVQNLANFLNKLCKLYFLRSRAFKQSTICENQLTGNK